MGSAFFRDRGPIFRAGRPHISPPAAHIVSVVMEMMKRLLLPGALLPLAAALLLRPEAALAGARRGLDLCLGSVVPSLFPMMTVTALLLRAFRIPAMAEVSLGEHWNGHIALLDGYANRLYLDPDQELVDRLYRRYGQDNRPAREHTEYKEPQTV